MDMTHETSTTTQTTCERVKLPKGQDLVGYCENCGRPAMMTLRGLRVRSAKFVLKHVDSSDYHFIKNMGRTGQTIR